MGEDLALGGGLPERLQARLGHRFQTPDLLGLALIHRSTPQPAGSEREAGGAVTPHHNERLEFLGDAVLELVVSHLLYLRFPRASEGQMSLWRASMVNTTHLSRVAVELELGPCLVMGKGEERSGGRAKESILSSALEALVGAVYLDGGLAAASGVVERLLGAAIRGVTPTGQEKDFKSLLQERLQAVGWGLPSYRVVGVSGADHERCFEVECRVGEELTERGMGSSKRAAEREAARRLLERLDHDRDAA